MTQDPSLQTKKKTKYKSKRVEFSRGHARAMHVRMQLLEMRAERGLVA